MSADIDFKALLRKYMLRVMHAESVAFVERVYMRSPKLRTAGRTTAAEQKYLEGLEEALDTEFKGDL